MPSTLAVVQAVKANLLRFQSVLPDDIELGYQGALGGLGLL
jgi:hypothetical protein